MKYINNCKSKIKYCRKCRSILTIENTTPSVRTVDYICRKCFRIVNKTWKKANSVETFKDGKSVRIYGRKRERPQNDLCEVCTTNKIEGYHHWDDTNLLKGMWICNSCHYLANSLEKLKDGRAKKYFNLKNKLEGGEYKT